MNHVAAEFVGRARAFRARIGAEDDAVGRNVLEIMKPLKARRRRSATFRPEALIDAERQFRHLPSAGRLTLKVDRDKSGLLIEEFRAAAGDFRFVSWLDGATDADIGICRVILEAKSWGPVYTSCDVAVSVSLHALARRFQRGFDTSDGAILSEFQRIALQYVGIAAALGDFAIAGDGGAWVGEVASTQVGEVVAPVLAIRTFTPAGAPVRGLGFAATV